jgi:hypothetical protein
MLVNLADPCERGGALMRRQCPDRPVPEITASEHCSICSAPARTTSKGRLYQIVDGSEDGTLPLGSRVRRDPAYRLRGDSSFFAAATSVTSEAEHPGYLVKQGSSTLAMVGASHRGVLEGVSIRIGRPHPNYRSIFS